MTKRASSILVATDFSGCSDRALAQAIELAELMGARLDLIHVHDVQVAALPELMLAVPGEGVDVLRRLRDQLRAVRDKAIAGRVPCQIHLRIGDPVGGLLDAAEEIGPALIVVGSHGRGAIMRALMGSVSERLCRRSAVPVLVVPAPERAAHAAEEDQARGATSDATAPDAETGRVAWSCAACGHIRGAAEGAARCRACGADPALWNSAPVTSGPVDAVEPAVGDSVDEHIDRAQANDPAAVFPTSPPGTSGYDVNPELRVRY